MRCPECGANAEKAFTTSVTDLGKCLIIVRNVPCYKCSECSEIIYTGDVAQRLERIIAAAKQLAQQISIIDYGEAA
jgi:YgiT-type zinc finger domain-containing protein